MFFLVALCRADVVTDKTKSRYTATSVKTVPICRVNARKLANSTLAMRLMTLILLLMPSMTLVCYGPSQHLLSSLPQDFVQRHPWNRLTQCGSIRYCLPWGVFFHLSFRKMFNSRGYAALFMHAIHNFRLYLGMAPTRRSPMTERPTDTCTGTTGMDGGGGQRRPPDFIH